MHIKVHTHTHIYIMMKSEPKKKKNGGSNLDTGNKMINTLYWSVENSIPKNNDRCREDDCSIVV